MPPNQSVRLGGTCGAAAPGSAVGQTQQGWLLPSAFHLQQWWRASRPALDGHSGPDLGHDKSCCSFGCRGVTALQCQLRVWLRTQLSAGDSVHSNRSLPGGQQSDLGEVGAPVNSQCLHVQPHSEPGEAVETESSWSCAGPHRQPAAVWHWLCSPTAIAGPWGMLLWSKDLLLWWQTGNTGTHQ